MKRKPQIRVGTNVVLRANKAEGWPEENAKVLGFEGRGNTLMVYVQPVDDADDGIREITIDQIKSIRKR